MTTTLLTIAKATVRAWTAVYTWRLPAALREARRDEIESDLWESEHDGAADDDGTQALHVFARLLSGVPDDVGWRFEQAHPMKASTRTWIVGSGVSAAAVLAAWIAASSADTPPPPMPRAPRVVVEPPPPPPPPPVPPGSTRPTPAVGYAWTSYRAVGDVQPPMKIGDVPPVYPPIAIAADLQGVVIVEATVDPTGRVADTQVVRSIPLFDRSAIDAVRQWRFEPPKKAVTIAVRVNFTR